MNLFLIVAHLVAGYDGAMVIRLRSWRHHWFNFGCWAAAAGLIMGGCRRSESPVSRLGVAAAAVEDLDLLKSNPVGAAIEGHPWIAHAIAVDLDHDGLMDIVACDTKANAVVWVRQTKRGVFEESVLAADLNAPVHVEAIDIDGDGDLDLLVACMGEVFPNNAKIGSVVILENDGQQHFKKHVILENTSRVTDVRAGDFNGDGKLDLAVGQFGYDQGEIRWMENMGNWEFKSHILLNRSGTVNVCVGDLTGQHHQDIVAVVSQEWEEIYLFENDGRGNFTSKIIYGSTNSDYGSSGISLCDLNRDGRMDVLYTNGDGFDYAQPGSRPWHGVQWLENQGGGLFKFHRIGNFKGAYSPVGVDLDGDGAMDVVAVSAFNEWTDPLAVSLMYFKNDGRMNFTPHVLARTPTHLLSCVATDMDGTGQPVLVTGGFHAYPPWGKMSRLMLWRKNAKP